VNYPYLHLAVNHLPVLGAIFALLLLAWGVARGSRDVTRVALGAALLAGLSAYPAYFTGDEAHEQLEEMPGYDHDRTHEHEEAAEAALIALLATAGAGGLGLWVSRKDRAIPVWSVGLVGLGLLASAGLVARAAMLGGEITHLEARQPVFAPPTAAGPAGAPAVAPAAGDSTVHRHGDGTEHRH
jgi:hypothetical protein